MMNDPLAAALSRVLNAEKVAKKECAIKPVSSLLKRVFAILQEAGYVGSLEITDLGRKGEVGKLNLLGRINKCNAIKPRSSVTLATYEKFEGRFLPAKDFGVLIVSTPKGIMTHIEAKKKRLGGKLLAYCY